MKNKTALKRSIVGFKFAIAMSVITLIIAIKWLNWYSVGFLAFALFHLVGDGINILYLKKKGTVDTEFLEQEIK